MMMLLTSKPLALQRFIAVLAAVVLLLQAVTPAIAVAIEAHHDDVPAPHGPSLVQCGDGDPLAGGPTGATLRLMAIEPVQLFPAPDVTSTAVAAIRSTLAWHTVIPDIPPPRVPDSL
jgi:hypothetical protein